MGGLARGGTAWRPTARGAGAVEDGGNGGRGLGGTVLWPEDTLRGGEVFFRAGGRIACVDCHCSGTPGYDDAAVVTCAGGVISPGLINPHEHLGFAATRPIGDSVDLRIMRRGRPQTMRFSLVAPPEDPPRNLTLLRGRNPFAGATVGNLSPALGAEMGAEDMTEGVVLLGIQRGSTAERLGLRPQDIVREVNGKRIERVADLQEITDRPQERWRVVLTRGDRVLQFEVAG